MATLEEQYDSSKYFLQAVNVLLQTINEAPIDTEEDVSELLEASIAASVINETKKEVLASGWDCNKDDDYFFPPDTEGYIAIPANVLDVSSTDGNLIMRDWRLYSKKDQSALFDEAQKLNVIWNIEFNGLIHPIRNYITVRAARKFQARQVMDTNVYAYTQQDEEDAYIAARRSEGRTGNYNMLDSAYGIDSRARIG